MTKIKICGITNYEDAINSANLGADYLGFNFYRKSPRYIEKGKAKKIIENLPKKVKKVGIFVNEEIKKVAKISNFCKLDLIQLSGDEDKEFILNLKKVLNKKVIKSFRIKKMDDIKKLKQYKTDYILLDSFKKGLYGGTGMTFDLKLAESIDNKRLFLSGGLNASNVKLAIGKLKPYAVDACSGIEVYPGKKYFGKLKEFIEVVK